MINVRKVFLLLTWVLIVGFSSFTSATTAGIYQYDADGYFDIDSGGEFKDQQFDYGDASNFHSCCNESQSMMLQGKTQAGSFFAFIDGFFITKETTKNLSKVKKEVREEAIGDGKFTKKTKVIPGKGPGQSRSEMEFVKNSDGKLVRSRKFSFDRGNKFGSSEKFVG